MPFLALARSDMVLALTVAAKSHRRSKEKTQSDNRHSGCETLTEDYLVRREVFNGVRRYRLASLGLAGETNGGSYCGAATTAAG